MNILIRSTHSGLAVSTPRTDHSSARPCELECDRIRGVSRRHERPAFGWNKRVRLPPTRASRRASSNEWYSSRSFHLRRRSSPVPIVMSCNRPAHTARATGLGICQAARAEVQPAGLASKVARTSSRHAAAMPEGIHVGLNYLDSKREGKRNFIACLHRLVGLATFC